MRRRDPIQPFFWIAGDPNGKLRAYHGAISSQTEGLNFRGSAFAQDRSSDEIGSR